ncbi:hypothetical protein EII34_06330 [Arachnia propionica]|uniref:Uncharacterized protein n=2 Tax=Arachnia propionica TaxID=1750 RepID=A0A3P1T762_9ACTN|nr:hypothetical protein [Arachnia propionica]RRD05347.1 hypothetical protein EII34_06330 [Arachnia propionica]
MNNALISALCVALLAGCGGSPEPVPSQEFDDVVALEPPPGYEFIAVGDSEPVHDWEIRLSSDWPDLIDYDPGVGAGMVIQSGMGDRDPLKPSMGRFDEFCAEVAAAVPLEEGVSRVEALPRRLIDDGPACGLAWQQGEGETAQVVMRWDLCRRDGCWRIVIKGAEGRDHVRGEFLTSLETLRFVPRPVVGDDVVVPSPEPSPSATKS